MPMAKASLEVHALKVTADAAVDRERSIPQEVPVALVYDGTTHAVMMASPSDLEDFAVGFSLSEGVIASPDEIRSLDVIEQESGIELRMWLSSDRGRNLVERRRRLAGPTGCGLCGIESLEAAVPACPQVSSALTVTARQIADAVASLPPAQHLNRETHAVHGAGFWTKEKGLVALAEDVGRHNALDKLIGRLRRAGIDSSTGLVLLTSRVSVEMVQKAAVAGAPILVAISAPTALALKTAEAAGITLVAVARADGFEIFTHPHRIEGTVLRKGKRRIAVEHAA
jgi:FdhD protein